MMLSPAIIKSDLAVTIDPPNVSEQIGTSDRPTEVAGPTRQ